MKIELLGENDIAECLNIYNYYIENTVFTLEEQSLTLENFKSRTLNISKNYPYIVIKSAAHSEAQNTGDEFCKSEIKEKSETVLGYAYLDVFNPRSAYRKTADLSIYVDKNHTREGIGDALLKEIETLAKARGIKAIISIITSENSHSVSFHEKNGFVFKGELTDVAEKFGKNISVSFYEKTLSD